MLTQANIHLPWQADEFDDVSGANDRVLADANRRVAAAVEAVLVDQTLIV